MKKLLEIVGLVAILACAAVVCSCTDFFTSSLAGWAARDPDSLIPDVTTGNVQELIDQTENSPGQSLALLKKIQEANGAGNAALQSAALQAAVNASSLGTAIMKNAGDIADISGDANQIVADAIGSLTNLDEITDILLGPGGSGGIIPSPGTTQWDAFVDKSSAEDMAMVAALLVAADAKANGGSDPAGYISGASYGPGNMAYDLAQAAKTKYTGGGTLADVLDGLGL